MADEKTAERPNAPAREPSNLKLVGIDSRFKALCLIRGAFRLADRPLDDCLEAVIRVRIQDAHRAGVRGSDNLAFQALEREGYTPSWVTRGDIRTIGLC